MEATATSLILFMLSSFSILSHGNPSRSANLKELAAHGYDLNSTGICKIAVLAHPQRDGIATDSVTKVIEVCCKGYTPYEYDTTRCIPECPEGCGNGFCVAPNVCTCFGDHVRSHDDNCVPTCPISCLNGVCHTDGTCTCNERHILDLTRKFCMPICRGSCGINRYCSAPGVCSCIRGFKVNPVSGECDPVCPMNCLRGRCISPGVCSCQLGYHLKDDVCQGNCSNCENGKCVTNEICSCDPGYTFSVEAKRCIPVCSQCANGYCVAPGVCECKEGYERVAGTCLPVCDGGCSNGYCVAHSICNCKEGYARNLFKKCKRLRCTIADATKSVCSIKHIGS